MKAVIMAGGKGTRLRPLTCTKPKPMVPIANRPMMEHIVNLLKEHHFNEILATLFYLPETVMHYFDNGSSFGVKMDYFLEETPLGTAGSVRNAAGALDETFLVISGDALTDIDLSAAVAYHREKQALATLILTKVDNPLEYGVVITKTDGQIERFLEKPGWGEVFSDTVNTGIYILEPEIFKYYQPGQVFDFSKDLFPLLLAKGEPLYGYIAEGYWSDIGNLDQYRQAHYDLLAGKVKLSIPGHEIQPGIWVGIGTEISTEAELNGPIILGDYCQIKSGVKISELSVIGNYAVIQEAVSLKRTILWDHIYLGSHAEIRGAILSHNTYLKGYNAVFEGAVLGEGVVLGARAQIKSQVKIWPEKEIDSGTVVRESLIWARKSSRSLFGNNGVNGRVNRGLTPETAVKLGAVFGASLNRGAYLTVSSDNFRAARIFKRALSAGILSVGVNVYDLGTCATPITRYALTTLGANGGVHLRIDSDEPEGLLIEFFDSQGLNLSKNIERSLENAFLTEDFPRATAANMGELTFVPQLIKPYLQGLVTTEIKELISQKQFTLVADYDQGGLAMLLPALFDELGCQVINVEETTNNQIRPRTLREQLGAISRVGNRIQNSQANLGVIVDNNAERLILLDENGEILKEEQLISLLSFLALKYQPETTVPVQVTAPQAIEDLAEQYHGKVIRTKANPRSLMERIVQERLFSNLEGQHIHQTQLDALFCLIKVLELLTREEVTLSEAKRLIPLMERGYREVDCPWEVKGRIMRQLYEENKEREMELTDGLKVFHNQAWALVLPDADEPIFKIYAEANTSEEADALTNLYLERINELQL